MINIGKRQQSIIIALAILFLLGRVMGLHAHGHVESNHAHDPSVETVHHHSHSLERTHLVSHMSDNHGLISDHEDHVEKTFEIENTAIVKKQNNNFDFSLFFLIAIIAIAWFRPRSLLNTKPLSDFTTPFPEKPYTKAPPLRAPPHLV